MPKAVEVEGSAGVALAVAKTAQKRRRDPTPPLPNKKTAPNVELEEGEEGEEGEEVA